MSSCFDCEIEGDDEDPGCGHPTVYCSCDCHEPDPEQLDAEEERWSCADPAHCIMQGLHLRDECYTAEEAAAYHDAAAAEAAAADTTGKA